MSVISLLIFDQTLLPTLAAVAEEAVQAGDPIEFPHDADLRTHAGYLPVRVMGRDTGFEHYFEPVSPGALPDEAAEYGSHHIVTRTGSSLEEGRAALLYLKVIARLTGGAYVYPDDAIIVGPEQAQSYLDAEIIAYGDYIK
jgi:hypothetical protein